MQLVM